MPRVLGDRHRQHQPLGLAVLGDQRHAVAAVLGGGRAARSRAGWPSIRTSPSTPRSTPKSASSSSRWPWPSRPPRPTISPLPTLERDVVEPVGPAQVPDLQHRLGGRVALRLGRVDVRPLAPDHQLDDLLLVPLALREGLDVAAVAEHRAGVGQRLDLVHAVRDVEERQALVAQLVEDRVDLLDVGAGQGRGRLVEDQEPRVAAQRLGDLDHLPARQGQVASPAPSGFTSSQPTRASSSSARRRWARRSIRPKRRGGSAMQMLSATERSGISDSSWKMQTMPAALAAGGSAKRTSLPVEAHGALVRLHHAGDDLDQRRLAGAVLAQDGVDRALAAGEVDALQRPHAAIALADAGELEEGRCDVGHRLSRGNGLPGQGGGPARAGPPGQRGLDPRPRPRVGRGPSYFTLSADFAMMSGALMFTPQGGNSFAAKKLSVRLDQ